METPNVPAGSTSTPPVQTQPNPGQFTVPDGKSLIDATEYETLKRNNERVRGMETFYQKASGLGFKKPEDLDRFGKFSKAMQARGLDLDRLTGALAEPEQQETKAEGTQQPFDHAAYEKKLEGLVEQRFARKDAESQHREALKSADGRIESVISELAGDNATEREKKALMREIRWELESRRKPYPEGHPLRDFDLSPPDEALMKTVVDELKAERNAGQGQALTDKADAIKKAVRTSPAGGSTATAKAPESGGQQDDKAERRAKAEAYAEKIRQARTGGPMSQARR